MHYIESPQEFTGSGPALFLAGGISDTANWQAALVQQLRDVDWTIINPRRANYERTEANDRAQISWEFRHLQRCSLVVFWFPPPTLCPIALFELGACCSAGIQLVVGTDRKYERRFDLQMQLSLRRPEIQIVNSLSELAEQIERQAAMVSERVTT